VTETRLSNSWVSDLLDIVKSLKNLSPEKVSTNSFSSFFVSICFSIVQILLQQVSSAMSYLEWNLDTEEDLDLNDLMGNIKILGDEGVIEEEYTNLDNFFEAFIEGINQMDIEGVVSIDPIVEPNDIIFKFNGNTIKMKYGIQTTIILNKAQFLEDLQNAVAKFLQELDTFSSTSNQQNKKFTKLRNFLLK
jgi:hypothetical protein